MKETDKKMNDSTTENEALEMEFVCTRNAYGIIYPPQYDINEFGIQKKVKVKDEIKRIHLGSRLDIAAVAVQSDGCEPSLLLKFKNIKGEDRSFVLPLESLVAKNSDWAKELVHAGYLMTPEARKDLVDFFNQTVQMKENKTKQSFLAKQNGWKDSSYVLNDRVYGSNDSIVPSVPTKSTYFTTNGTYAEWKKTASLAQGNAVFEFALATAFAPLLLKPLWLSNGIIFHLWGDTSSGKSIAQGLAQSVWGPQAQISSWSGTQNGIELLMASSNDNLVCLDEFGRAKCSIIEALVYMIANGVGKTRATRNVTLREQNRWATIGLSTGEVSYEDKMREIETDPRAGAMLRIPTIRVSRDMLKDLHGYATGKLYVDAVNALAQQNYGFAGRDFLEHLTADNCRALENLDEKVNAYAAELLPKEAGTQLERATKFFAMPMVAADMLMDFGIIDFDCKPGVRTLYRSYLEQLSTLGNSEEHNIARNVVSFIQKHQKSRFINCNLTSEEREKEKVHNCIGYFENKGKSQLFYFYPDLFYDEVAKSSNKKLVKKVLLEKKMLVLDPSGKNPNKTFGTGKGKRYVCISLDNMVDEDADASSTPSDGINSFILPATKRSRKIDATRFKF